MTTTNQATLALLELLPKEEQLLAKKEVERIVLAWDPDFTKVTPEEAKELEEAEAEIERGEVYTQEEAMKILGI